MIRYACSGKTMIVPAEDFIPEKYRLFTSDVMSAQLLFGICCCKSSILFIFLFLQNILQCVETQDIAFLAEACYLTCTDRGDNGMMPEFLTLVDIGHMHFDNGNLHCSNGVPYSIAVVSICACVDNDTRKVKACLMDTVDYLALAVGLEALAL